MSDGETSGVDLARVALRAAMEQAQKNSGGQKAKQKPRPVLTVGRDGREPMGFGAAIGGLWSPIEPGSSRRFPACDGVGLLVDGVGGLLGEVAVLAELVVAGEHRGPP